MFKEKYHLSALTCLDNIVKFVNSDKTCGPSLVHVTVAYNTYINVLLLSVL